WAEGAKPEDYQGPDNTVTVVDNTIEGGKRTVTTTVAQGTDAETKTVQVLDLATGQAIETTDAAGIKSTATYDVLGRPLTQTAYAGIEGKELVNKITYDSPTKTTLEGPDGKRTTTETDALGRQKSVADNVVDGKAEGPDAARTLSKTTYTWANNNLVTTVTDTAGRVTTTTTGAAGTQSVTTNPDGTSQRTVSDAVANKQSSGTIPKGGSTTSWTNAPAVTTQLTDTPTLTQTVGVRYTNAENSPAPAAAVSVFDGLGRAQSSTGGDITTTPVYGNGGQATGATLAPASPEQFPGTEVTAKGLAGLTGQGMNKKLSEKDGDQRSGRSTVYDAAGRVVSQSEPNGTVHSYHYNAKGQSEKMVVTGKDGKILSETVRTYDDATGRPLTVVVTGEGKDTQKKSFSYHHKTGQVESVWDTDNEQGSKIVYGYDADGLVTSMTYPDGKQVAQKFDKAGQLQSSTDITGATTHYTYNQDGSLKKTAQFKKGDDVETATPITVVDYDYDNQGRMSKTVQGNGHTTQREFHDSGQVKKETTTTKDGHTVFAGEYAYDSHGNLTRQT
ncbi:hypothetical protein ACFWBC_40325, partial [Streptomyces sp. NPDC059985]|uniref:hypothetical protein n=1 Tax=Streptomyces sp. NPDC059985 TaxID=3347025 RepID=UPI0036A801E5